MPRLVKDLRPDIVLFDLEPVGHDPDIMLRELCRLSRVLILGRRHCRGDPDPRGQLWRQRRPLQRLFCRRIVRRWAWRIAIGCSFFSNIPFLMEMSTLSLSPDEKQVRAAFPVVRPKWPGSWRRG
ncbi:hypothetical protein ACQ86N_15390 [Puia sp. P3]|uniref:hypothetical protein n=1 Tax=Puia sp. P3 TaxID=3423952 RepID=UPI003D6787FA